MRTVRVLADVPLFTVVKSVFAYMVASAEGTFQGYKSHRVFLDSLGEKNYKMKRTDS